MAGAKGAPKPIYTAAAMNRARELAASDWKAPAIRRILEQEGYGHPSVDTVRGWIDPVYAANCAARQTAVKRVKRAQTARFRLNGRTPEYRLAFMRVLRSQGVSCRAIGVTHGVVFGEALSEWQVRQAFGGHDPKVTNIGREANAAADPEARAA